MHQTVIYFAYGSNMSSRRLQARVPSATLLDIGELRGHRLAFHKFSHVDFSAKCDAYATGDPADSVIGVLYELHANEKPLLDSIEGVGNGYEEKRVTVDTGASAIAAYLYSATHIDPDVKPFSWYKEHVMRGAREHELPDDYLNFLEHFESIADPQRDRHLSELGIYDAES